MATRNLQNRQRSVLLGGCKLQSPEKRHDKTFAAARVLPPKQHHVLDAARRVRAVAAAAAEAAGAGAVVAVIQAVLVEGSRRPQYKVSILQRPDLKTPQTSEMPHFTAETLQRKLSFLPLGPVADLSHLNIGP